MLLLSRIVDRDNNIAGRQNAQNKRTRHNRLSARTSLLEVRRAPAWTTKEARTYS